jgi:hypothetical protein
MLLCCSWGYVADIQHNEGVLAAGVVAGACAALNWLAEGVLACCLCAGCYVVVSRHRAPAG